MAKNLRLADSVTIANGGTVSTTLAMEGSRIPLAILIPAAMTSTAMTFQASNDNATFYAIYFESTSYSVTVPTATVRHIALDRKAMEGVRYFRCVGGSAEGAERTIKVISGE